MGLIKKKARGLFIRSMATRATAAMVVVMMIMTMCIIMMPLSVFADDSSIIASGKAGDSSTWILNSEGTLTVSGSGKINGIITDLGLIYHDFTWDLYAEQVKRIVIKEGITVIWEDAFENCTEIEYIEIPASVSSIYSSSFTSSENLNTIKVDSENKAYRSEGNCLISNEENKIILGCKNSKIPFGITSVSGFRNCSSLEHIDIPNSVQTIEYAAFWGCSALEDIDIPDSVKKIEQEAFNGCISLKEVALSENVDEIGTAAFGDCSGLEKIHVNEKNENYRSEGNCIIFKENNYLILGCKTSEIPLGVEVIGEASFRGCSELASIDIPESVTKIEDSAFSGCECLESILLPNSINEIEERAFYGCSSLKSISIPDSVTDIDFQTFDGCSNLKNIKLPKNLKWIWKKAFYRCSSLESIEILQNVTYIGENVFSFCSSLKKISVDRNNKCFIVKENCLIEKKENILIAGCQSGNIPEGVVKIAAGAFTGRKELKSIKIPSTLENLCYVEDYTVIFNGVRLREDEELMTFSECCSLESIRVAKNNKFYKAEDNCLIDKNTKSLLLCCKNSKIPDDIEIISDEPFYNNKSITELEIPTSVKYIEDIAFTGCENLTILGYTNSYAEEFAKENNITFKSIGTVYKFSYEDVDDASWYFDSVKSADQMGLINGVDETLFKPDLNITYAQAITLAARMHQKYMTGCVTLENGCGGEAWYQPYVDYCLENHIIESDYSDIMNDTIDRQTYAEIFAKALPDKALVEKNTIFDGAIPDVASDNPHYASIYKLYRAGICNGIDTSGSFYPEKSIKRSEVAAILVRMMDESARVGAVM